MLSLDYEIADLLAQLGQGKPAVPKPPVGDVMTRRKNSLYRAHLQGASKFYDDVQVQDFSTSVPDGHSLLLRWYTKKDSSPGSAVLFVHGGGFIVGEVEFCDNVLSEYVSLSGVPMLSVEYRLSPEAQYPVPVLDVYTSLKWLHEHAIELGVDPSRVGICGNSAGGGLAVMCSLWAREQNGPHIAKQFIHYGMLDDRTVVPNPHLSPGVSWNHIDNETGWGAFLGSKRGTDNVPETAAPGRMADATGMPPLHLDVGDVDIVTAENLEYAMKHIRAGVGVELHVRRGCPHSFETLGPKTAVAKRSIADRVRGFQSL
jgi:acetyl esterase/lipase